MDRSTDSKLGWLPKATLSPMLDIKNAFLNDILEEELYMTQPPGFVVQEEASKVCLLKRSLYGLKQSPQAWFGCLSQALSEFGMTRSASDHSVFYRHLQKKTIILVTYVDDLIITGNDAEGISPLKKFLSEQFQIIDLGKLKYFLGIEILRSSRKILICERKYVLDMFSEYGLRGCKPTDSAMVPEVKLMPEDGEPLHDPERYLRLVRKLNYLIVTRPDIAYPVSVVSQFMSAPRTTHWDTMVRILRYLKGSPGKGLVYSNQGHNRITAFTDADRAGCPINRRSTTGYCVFFGGNLIS
ncbi:Retrovirus-related Pol polyprotein from transposon RE1-like protein [Drosera capensis]